MRSPIIIPRGGRLYKIQLPLCRAAGRLESSLQIKKAGGLQPGKNDAIDAVGIAEYAFRFRDKIRLWQPPRPVLQKLAALSGLRQRLLLVRQQLQQPIREQQRFIDPSLHRQLTKSCQASLDAIKVDLRNADRQIRELIQADDYLRELFDLVTARRPGSVPGVGDATATEVLIATEEFKTISDAKKLAASAVRLPCRSSSF